MSIQEVFELFIEGIKRTSALEYIAVFAGIVSVWFSRIENIWVYPIGLISTIIYIYLSFKEHLMGEATVNLYYSAMSIYGWILWARKDQQQEHEIKISFSGKREWAGQLTFFAVLYIAFFLALTYLQKYFYPGVIPAGDAFASATAFTGMWLMAKKKVESWYWWLATNIASVPLYFTKGLAFTSVFYVVLFIMAIFGLIEWKRRARENYA